MPNMWAFFSQLCLILTELSTYLWVSILGVDLTGIFKNYSNFSQIISTILLATFCLLFFGIFVLELVVKNTTSL